MSSVFSKDVSGHVEKMSFRVWHLECLSVTTEKNVGMVCIDFKMILHQKHHLFTSAAHRAAVVYHQQYVCRF